MDSVDHHKTDYATLNPSIPTSGTFTVPANKVIDVGTSGSLILTGASSNGAQLAATGKLTAGATEITGVWQAVDSGSNSDTITIAATGTEASSITASAATVVFTAVDSGSGVITQAAVANNALTIAAATTVALGGDGTEVGKIVLKGDATNPGKLTFENSGSSDVGTSIVTTESNTSSNLTDAVTKIAGNASVGTAIAGYFDDATIGSATKFWKLGASNSSNSIVGGGASTDTELSGKAYSTGDFGT